MTCRTFTGQLLQNIHQKYTDVNLDSLNATDVFYYSNGGTSLTYVGCIGDLEEAKSKLRSVNKAYNKSPVYNLDYIKLEKAMLCFNKNGNGLKVDLECVCSKQKKEGHVAISFYELGNKVTTLNNLKGELQMQCENFLGSLIDQLVLIEDGIS